MHTELPLTAPPPLSPAQAPCSSISLQPHPQLVSVCSQSLLPPQVFHLSSSTSMVMPVITSQAQNQSLLYHSYSLNCSCSTQRPWLSPYCFYARLLPHQQESSIYTKKKQQKQSCALSWCIVSPATNVFNVWGCQDVWVTGAQTMSMESYCPRFLQWETVDLLCIMGFVHHPLNFVTSPVRRANC